MQIIIINRLKASIIIPLLGSKQVLMNVFKQPHTCCHKLKLQVYSLFCSLLVHYQQWRDFIDLFRPWQSKGSPVHPEVLWATQPDAVDHGGHLAGEGQMADFTNPAPSLLLHLCALSSPLHSKNVLSGCLDAHWDGWRQKRQIESILFFLPYSLHGCFIVSKQLKCVCPSLLLFSFFSTSVFKGSCHHGRRKNGRVLDYYPSSTGDPLIFHFCPLLSASSWAFGPEFHLMSCFSIVSSPPLPLLSPIVEEVTQMLVVTKAPISGHLTSWLTMLNFLSFVFH